MFSMKKSCFTAIQIYIIPLLLSLLISSISDAEEDSRFHLDATQGIIYCDITPSFNQKKITQSLQAGMLVHFSWHIVIESIQPYWLNQQVADIQFNRSVIPDLLSQQWQLKDSLTGITSYTLSLSQAVQFLSHIKQFPLIDKSLLAPHTSYLISVSLNIEQGEANDTWWHDILNSEHTIASSILNLP